ncbi:hypothetical protein MICAK_820010 [Microcystis aeruginosa PCC 9701]|uniref:Uncharacterized protein n=1 Tax=Microcystis aeruginosa PCC 9701 TaxID=721123 RepID=I4IXK9_MICAE|nr:hypothetical protein MICAK_820010 [Microcystis aeruginosa PCC 9701]
MVRSTPSLGGMYLRIHFTHQIQESPKFSYKEKKTDFFKKPVF